MVIGGLVLLLILALSWISMTTGGARWVAKQLSHAEPRLSIAVTEGRLLTGLTLASVDWDDGEARVAIRASELAWSSGCLWLKHCELHLQADDVDVQYVAATTDTSTPAPAAIAPLALPFSRLQLTATVNRLQVSLSDQTITVSEVATDLSITDARFHVASLMVEQVVRRPVMPVEMTATAATPAEAHLDQIGDNNSPIFTPFDWPTLPVIVTIDKVSIGSLIADNTQPDALDIRIKATQLTVDGDALNIESLGVTVGDAEANVSGEVTLHGMWNSHLVLEGSLGADSASPIVGNVTIAGDFGRFDWEAALLAPLNIQAKGNLFPLQDNLPVSGTLLWNQGVADQWLPEGIALQSGRATFDGRLINPLFDLGLISAIQDTNSLESIGIELGAIYDQDQLEIYRGIFTQAEGHLALNGVVTVSPRMQLDLEWDAQHFKLPIRLAEQTTWIDGRISTIGHVDDAFWEASIATDAFDVVWNEQPFNLQGELSINSDLQGHTKGITLVNGVNKLEVTGGYQTEWDGSLSVVIADTSHIIDGLAATLEGNIEVTGARDTPILDLDIRIADVIWADNAIGNAAIAGSMAWLDQPIIDLQLQATNARLGTQRVSNAKVSVIGSTVDHLVRIELDADMGAVDTTLTGTLSDMDHWIGSLNQAQIRSPLGQWVLSDTAGIQLDIQNAVATINDHCWRSQEAQICANEPLILGTSGRASLSMHRIDFASVSTYLPEVVALNGKLDGSLTAAWIDAQLTETRAVFIGQPGELAVTIDETNTVTIPFNNWQVLAEQESTGWTFNANLSGQGIGQLAGQATVAGMPSAEGPWVVDATLDALQLASFSSQIEPYTDVSGTVKAQVRLSGALADPQFTGSVSLSDGQIHMTDLPERLSNVDLLVAFDNQHADISAHFDMGGGQGAVMGQGDWQEGDWRADIQLTADHITLYEQTLDAVRLGFTGGLLDHSIQLAVAHPLADFSVTVDGGLNAEQHWIGSIPTANITAEVGSWTTRNAIALDIDIPKQIAQLGAHCWTSNTTAICADQPLVLGTTGSASLTLTDADLQILADYYPDGIEVSGVADGTLDAQWQDGQLTGASAVVTGRPGKATVTGRSEAPLAISYDEFLLSASQMADGWVIDAAIMGEGIGQLSSHAVFDGLPAVDAPMSLTASLTDMTLAPFASLLPPTMSANATVAAQILVKGSMSTPDISGKMVVSDGRFHSESMPLLIEQASIILVLNNELLDVVGDFNLGGGNSSVSGQADWRGGNWWSDFTLSGQQIALFDQALQSFQIGFIGGQNTHDVHLELAQNDRTVRIDLSGGYTSNAHWVGNLTQAVIDSEFGIWQTARPTLLDLDINASTVDIAPHCWQNGAAAICADRELAIGLDGDIALSFSRIDLSLFSNYMPEGIQPTGVFGGNVSVAWTDANLTQLSAVVSGERGEVLLTTGMTDPLVLPFTEWSIQTDQVPRGWSLKTHVLGDGIGMFSSHINVEGIPSLDAPINLVATLTDMPVVLFSALIDPTMTATGELSAQVQVLGTAAQPDISGVLSLAGGTFEQEGIPVAVDNVNVDVSLSHDTAAIDGHFTIGSGKGQIHGRAAWIDGGWTSTIEMTGANMIVKDPMMTLAISPSITLTVTETGADIKGVVEIPSGNIKISSLPDAAVTLSSDILVIQDDVVAIPPPKYQLTTNIDVKLGSAVWIEAYGLKSRLVGGVTIRQKDVSDPQLYGQIETQDGSFKALGANLVIRRGKLIFSGPIDKPLLDVEAVRVVNDITAGILARGVVTEPEITLFSEPAMTQAAILSYIMRGQPLEGGAVSEGLLATKVAMGIGIYGSDSPLTAVSEKLGIEDFNIDAEGTSDSARIALAGYLSPRLYFKYGVGVMNAANEVTLRYKLLPRLFVESITGINSAVDLIYTVEF